ncbi:molybdopterin-guanine dinucleotide biosynthesis protein B [Halobacteria archaeon AArc-m2/3/4]|uniref:Molybdopterin-guanine dinucleotide biosynthesis protein B n=1 Tax=Natronoglomus mannanivorans TaxID=2979990 RepID=A0AAP2YXZ6_9EURY|nr:molybdopterin-guanine dinucleotide biosynthesis protein B [Halobacteria archaeon AArc-xg1-1]MCU4973598.1 molybdopterin-guanine dinucleotide biosynthesis protein B [Halobacteria archaeon AArc-m2/3/4]
MTTVVCVVGPSDTGKTTLIESLVARLRTHGRVATVKSIHHDIEIDTPGKDTYRHREAGAETVVGITPSRTFRIDERGKRDGESKRETAILEKTVDDLVAEGYEYVLVEGFHRAPYPKIHLGDREGITPPVVARGVGASDIDVDDLVDRLLEGVGDGCGHEY